MTANPMATSDESGAFMAEDWWIYRGTGVPHDGIAGLPPAPPWRAFGAPDSDPEQLPAPPPEDSAAGSTARRLGRARQAAAYQADEREVRLVNLALHLRRPLLITGKPGVGKSTLAYAVAHELRLGPVLRWSISSRSSLRDGLYSYDAIGRLHEAGLSRESARRSDPGGDPQPEPQGEPPDGPRSPAIGRFLRLGPLGTALLPWRTPRVLLIDEIDKSDIDLPNDLLNVFEEGEFEIPELLRLGPDPQEVGTADHGRTAVVRGGVVRCAQFPLVVLTSNGERDFPSALLRRCVRLEIRAPDEQRLAAMVAAHLGEEAAAAAQTADLIAEFLRRQRQDAAELANDQLLNALLMAGRVLRTDQRGRDAVRDVLLRPLNES
ncbi:MoxR family ATPase [Kitasatospora purpeofusca]|uniref:AAA family ATPase n=1 Tax=Kitasatospora purpeofusca TaxID=67352 RepID=UPI002A59A059|nr:MoxR family ATPase [Kitasatospora purpeofusca]MDY0814098.1 MoxR family ATPase [Kitasatospora purpeofusca]